ncbi:MAG: hypothetical protein R3C10_02435 [Pirellulales bacterium]
MGDHAEHDRAAAQDATVGDVTRFSLASLMLLIVLAAVVFGLFAFAWGLGVVLTVMALPALVRTVTIQTRAQRAGVPLSPLDRVMAFLASLAVVTEIALAAIIAFVAVCLPLGVIGGGLAIPSAAWLGVLVGTVVGLWVAYLVGRMVWNPGRSWLRDAGARLEKQSTGSEVEDTR